MRAELREEDRLRDPAGQHPAGLGGVVGHQDARLPPHPLEDAAQAPAEDLRPLARHRHAEAGVGVRQRHDEELEGARDARDPRPEVPEVDLGRPRPPLEPEVALPRCRDVPLPPGPTYLLIDEHEPS